MKQIITAITLTFCSSILLGQINPDNPAEKPVELPSDEVEVVKSFEVKTKTIKAIFPPPGKDLEEEETGSIGAFNYKVMTSEEEVPLHMPTLRPIAYTTPVIIDRYDGFVDISYGNPNAPNLDLGYNYNIEDWFEVGLLAHYGSADDDAYANRDFLSHGLKLYGKYNTSKNILSKLDLSYDADTRYFYGIPFNSELRQNDIKRSALNFTSALSIDFDYLKSSRYRAVVDLAYSNTDIDNMGQFEHKSVAGITIQKLSGAKNLIELDSEIRYYAIKPDENRSFKSLYALVKPSFYYNGRKDLHVQAGLDALKDDEGFYFQPNIEIDYRLNTMFQIHAGSRSHMQAYDSETINQQNPFSTFHASEEIRTHKAIRPFLGITLEKQAHSLSLTGQYNYERNMPVYAYQVESDIPSYTLQTADTKFYSSIMSYAAKLKHTSIELHGTYRFNAEAFLSKWKVGIGIDQNIISDRVAVFANADLLGKRSIPKASVIAIAPSTDDIYDLSIGSRIQFNKLFSLKLSMHNLLGKEYENWFAYPVYGRTFRIGAFTKF